MSDLIKRANGIVMSWCNELDAPVDELRMIEELVSENQQLTDENRELREARDKDAEMIMKLIKAIPSPIADESLKIFTREFKKNIEEREALAKQGDSDEQNHSKREG